jgi:hypothetical protein
MKAYVGADTADAKRKAFTRAVKTARENGLIGSREIAGINPLAGRAGQDRPDVQAGQTGYSLVSCPVRPVGAVRNAVGICLARSPGNMEVSFQAARSIG